MADSVVGIFASAALALIAANVWWQVPLVPAVVGAGGATLILYRRAQRRMTSN